MSQERTVESFGQKLTLGIGDTAIGIPGKPSYALLSTNEENCRFNIGHNQSGLSAVYSEGTFQFESGVKEKCGPGGENSIVVIAHNGGIAVNSDAGSQKFKAEQIVLKASKEIVIDAPSIRIGSNEKNATQDIVLVAKNVDAEAGGGKLGDLLGTSNFMSIFAGGALGGLAAAAAGIAGAAGGAAGQAGLGANGQGNSQGFAVSGGGGGTAIPSNITTLSQTLTSGQSNQTLMADGSTTTNYIGVGVGSTPTSSDVGNDGDIWYTLC